MVRTAAAAAAARRPPPPSRPSRARRPLDPPFPARCQQRCEASSLTEPVGHPVVGFYCPLHKYQTPRLCEDKIFRIDPALEAHLARRTSYVSFEKQLGADMADAPQLRRQTLEGGELAAWLAERKGLQGVAAKLTLQRMLEQGVIVAAGGKGASAGGAFAEGANYKVAAAGAKNAKR